MKRTYGKRRADMVREDHRLIILYGDSLILESVGAALAKHAQFEVLPLSPPLPGPAELEAIAPDVILFDVEAARPDAAFSLLETRPGLLLLGISPDGNLVRRWSGEQYQALSARDLSALIEGGCDARHASDSKLGLPPFGGVGPEG